MSVLDDIANVQWDGNAAEDAATLAAGEYAGVIVDWKFEARGEKQTPCMAVELEVTEGDSKGRHVWKTYWLTSKTMPYVSKDLKRIGRPITSMKELIAVDLQMVPVRFGYGLEKNGDQERLQVLWVDGPRYGAAAQKKTVVSEDAIPF